ncbi:MAG: hypothetical protein ACI93R_003950 [Flavobacteriales bacterium]|jgi:hypothetical protein
MKHEQPCALEAPPKAATVLELAIYNFEKKCDAHHSKAPTLTANGETGADKERRFKEWSQARDHLNQERHKINTLASMEAGLIKYREECNILTSSERLEVMRVEKHHPAKNLAKYLVAAGEPKPSLTHVAHHIVPGKGRWRQPQLLDIRLQLHMAGIRINDPRNGLWLSDPKNSKGHWATPESPTHKSVHGTNYEVWLVRQLGRLPAGKVFEAKLRALKNKMKNGTYPVKIEQPKDSEWNGKA